MSEGKRRRCLGSDESRPPPPPSILLRLPWIGTCGLVRGTWTQPPPSERSSLPETASDVPRSVCICMYVFCSCCSVAKSRLTPCDPTDWLLCPPLILPEFSETHVHQVSDAIQPSHPLSSPSPPAFYLSQHQGLF